MLHKMGQSEFGVYSLIASIVGYLTILDFGFGNAIIRYTAKYRVLNEKKNEYKLNGIFLILFSIIGLIVAFVGIFLYLNVGRIFSSTMTVSEIETAKILMLLFVFNLAISFPLGIFSSIIIAYEEFIFSKALSLISILISPCILVPLLMLGYRSIGVVAATTAINISILLINMWYCLNKLNIKFDFKHFDFHLVYEIFKYSSFIFLNIIVEKVNWSVDLVILGAVSGTAAVAIYSIASQLNTYYLSFSIAISSVFLPKLTSMVTNNASSDELSDLFIKIGRIQFIILAYVLSGFSLVGLDFITNWAGSNYSSAFYMALILMIPVTIPLIQNLGISLLQAQNRQSFRSIAYILVACINIGISIPLAKIYGGIGCAIGTAIGLTIGNIFLMNIYYYRKIHLNIPRFWREIFFMTIPVVIAFVLSSVASLFIVGSGYGYIFIKAVVLTICYIPLMWLMGMNKFERNLFYTPLKNIFMRIKENI
jgi:O-antigen/teichoic acid export membrane protein